jgi:hypothetical protein
VYNRSGQKRTLRTAISIFYNALRHKTFYRRREELGAILAKVKPSLVVIDVFSYTDLLVVKTLDSKINVVYFNPMLNILESRYPDVRGQKKEHQEKKNKALYRIILDRLSPLPLLANAAAYNPKGQLRWVFNKYPFLKKYSTHSGNNLVRLFQNVPEIILAPLELEFGPDVRREHQIYAGFSIPQKRIDIDCDPTFKHYFKEILNLKEEGRKLVYCSFGTYFSSKDEHRYVIAFFTLLIHAFRNESSIVFIIASKDTITEAVKAQTNIPKNFFIFTKVPQLSVLAHSDLFITHGGLGSIKEALYKAVPMLVYPLDLNWDQAGNALKIKYHDLGLSGNFRSDGANEIFSNTMKVLNNPRYVENCRRLNRLISSSYSSSQIIQFLSLK